MMKLNKDLLPPNCSGDQNFHLNEHISLLERIENMLTRKFKVINGTDNEGNEYESITEFWCKEKIIPNVQGRQIPTVHNIDHRLEWYQKGRNYWDCEDNAPATIDGMLGGYSEISERDLAFSKNFLAKLFSDSRHVLGERLLDSINRRKMSFSSDDISSCKSIITRSCECGAGIGRVTKGLLLPLGSSRMRI